MSEVREYPSARSLACTLASILHGFADKEGYELRPINEISIRPGNGAIFVAVGCAIESFKHRIVKELHVIAIFTDTDNGKAMRIDFDESIIEFYSVDALKEITAWLENLDRCRICDGLCNEGRDVHPSCEAKKAQDMRAEWPPWIIHLVEGWPYHDAIPCACSEAEDNDLWIDTGCAWCNPHEQIPEAQIRSSQAAIINEKSRQDGVRDWRVMKGGEPLDFMTATDHQSRFSELYKATAKKLLQSLKSGVLPDFTRDEWRLFAGLVIFGQQIEE